MLLPGFGPEGQRRLSASHAALIGCGALGTVIADALARAGVGRLTIIDRDLVEFTNLQRQVLFDETDARESRPKAEAAAARLRAVNSDIRIEPVVADLNPRNAERLVQGAGVLIDGTDNFQTRYLLNDLALKRGVPLVYGGVVGTTGLTMTIVPEAAAAGLVTPCLRCVFPDPPPPGASPTCDTAGVLGPMAGVVASIQAAEAMKVLLGRFDLVRAAMGQVDIWSNIRRTIDLAGIDRATCPCCAVRRFAFLEAPADDTVTLCGADAVQVLPPRELPGMLDLSALADTLRPLGTFVAGSTILRGSLREAGGGPLGLTVFRDGRAIIKGTTDLARARSIYARYIGA
jgi:adenylyltransferase/sulfurtransferase